MTEDSSLLLVAGREISEGHSGRVSEFKCMQIYLFACLMLKSWNTRFTKNKDDNSEKVHSYIPNPFALYNNARSAPQSQFYKRSDGESLYPILQKREEIIIYVVDTVGTWGTFL